MTKRLQSGNFKLWFFFIEQKYSINSINSKGKGIKSTLSKLKMEQENICFNLFNNVNNLSKGSLLQIHIYLEQLNLGQR